MSVDSGDIRDWRSIVTLVVFVITNLIVLFPFHIPIYLPRSLSNWFLDALAALRIISPQQARSHGDRQNTQHDKPSFFRRLDFPLNFVTAPLIADLFLLAILAIGRDEVEKGTVGTDGISPINIMVFFLTLAYIAISIDASGLIRYLAFKIVQKGGKYGHRLFFYLYAFFFGLGSFVGNDPIILSGTAFLAYMTRVSSNIVHPRAWIHTQFAVANIASAILVSSNPTNLVLAGAFQIKFIVYTANMIVPVVVTAIVLFPFLLYVVFADEKLIPGSIEMHELPDQVRGRDPVNPNIPHARGQDAEEEKKLAGDEVGKLSLEEIMNPFLDKKGAMVGAVVMAVTLVTLLVLNGVSQKQDEYPVYWVTLPAAVLMFCWDISYGWKHRSETRDIARKGRREVELAREQALREDNSQATGVEKGVLESPEIADLTPTRTLSAEPSQDSQNGSIVKSQTFSTATGTDKASRESEVRNETAPTNVLSEKAVGASSSPPERSVSTLECEENKLKPRQAKTLASLFKEAYVWSQETFPTATAVLGHLPFALVPFAFAMFVLVEALVTKGWVQVFAYGWDHWVSKTGIVGAIGGMCFLSVVLCNFAGTNIGTTILLSRVIQAWEEIHKANGIAISDRTFWGTVYGMALGVNYGAFSIAFSASLAGLLWRDILARKHIHVRRLEFARVNLPIIAIAMIIGGAVLTGEIYIIRNDSPYQL